MTLSLTDEQKKEVQHLCKVLGIGKLEAIARVLAKAESSSDEDDHTENDTTTLDE